MARATGEAGAKPLFNALSLAVGLALTALCVLLAWRPPLQPAGGLDPSWPMAAAYASTKGLVFGRDFIFTYGPYHALVTRFFDAATAPLVLFYDAFAVAAVFAPALRNRAIGPLLALTAIFVLMVMRQDALVVLALFGVFLTALQGRTWTGPVLVALCAPLVLAKLSFGLVLLPLALLADLDRALARRLPVVTLAFVAGVVAAYLAAGQPIGALGDFLASSLEVIAGYGGAMQYEGSWREIVAALVSAGVVAAYAGAKAWGRWRAERTDLRPLLVLLGVVWTLFVLFKIGFVRQDGHTAYFHSATPGVLALVAAWFHRPGERRGRIGFAVLFALVGFSSFYWMVFATRQHDAPMALGARAQSAVRDAGRQLATGVHWLDGRTMRQAAADREWALRALKRPFPGTVQGSVDILPWDAAEVIAAGLDYRPRPVAQSYSAYTPGLQEKDRAFFAGPRAPDTLILKVLDIDGRLPTLAFGPSLPVIAARYDPVGQDRLGLVLHRRAQPRATTVAAGTFASGTLESWFAAPAAPGRLLMARVEMQRSLAGRLMGLAFREPVVTVTLRTVGGRETAMRFIPGMAERGVAVSPLPADWDRGALAVLDPSQADPADALAALKVSSRQPWAFQAVRVAFDRVAVASLPAPAPAQPPGPPPAAPAH